MIHRRWTKAFIAVLALVAGSAASSFSDSPVTERWIADPEEQYLLDVKLRRSTIGDVVRAYPTPEGACVIFGDFLTTLDVPMKIDLEAQRASGWAFSEENTIDIDRAQGVATIKGNREAIATNAIREAAEGWCVATEALSSWFELDVSPQMHDALLSLESEAKLPVELAAERRRRAEKLRDHEDFDYASLPQVKLPYRMWRTPALDVVVDGGATYSAHSGVQLDQSAAVYASGEIAGMSFDGAFSVAKDRSIGARVRAYRSDVGGGLLGPLEATHLEVGDLMHGSNGIGTRYGNGRGALVTNRPLRRLADFDKVSFEGELPAGWDAELYRNGQLLAFASTTPDGRYLFDEIELTYGTNEIEIVLYGPQGQVRRRTEQVNVGAQQVPPGESWYFASVSQPGTDLLDFKASPDQRIRAQATAAFDHGIDQKMSAGLLAQTLLMDDGQVSWTEGSVRRTLGPVYVEASANHNSRGGTGARVRAITEIGDVSLTASSERFHGPTPEGDDSLTRAQHSLSTSIPFRIGESRIPLAAGFTLTEKLDGTKDFELRARTASMIGRVNLGAELDWHRRGFGHPTLAPTEEVSATLIGAGRIGSVRVKSRAEFDLGDMRLERAGINGYWSAGSRAAWDAGVAFEPRIGRTRARLSHVRKLDIASVALTAEAATDGSVAAGINLSFSLDKSNGWLKPTAQPLARTGSIKAQLFRDDNDNGIRDADEPFQTGVHLAAGHRLSAAPSNAEGEVLLTGLPTHKPIAIGIDQDSLADPSLAPKEALRVMIPRPGVTGVVQIPLVGTGIIEGMIENRAGTVEGIELVLFDQHGREVALTRSEFDGYFLFDQVPYGDYLVALSTLTAEVLMVDANLDTPATVSPDRPYVRLGTIALEPSTARIAQKAEPWAPEFGGQETDASALAAALLAQPAVLVSAGKEAPFAGSSGTLPDSNDHAPLDMLTIVGALMGEDG